MSVELDQYILRDFLGHPAIPGHPPGQRKYHRLMLLNELFKVRPPRLLSLLCISPL
jgi:hypothetical protein